MNLEEENIVTTGSSERILTNALNVEMFFVFFYYLVSIKDMRRFFDNIYHNVSTKQLLCFFVVTQSNLPNNSAILIHPNVLGVYTTTN